MKYKKKQLNTRLHRDLSTSVVNRYCVENPTFFQMEDIFLKQVYDYNDRFGFFINICGWKLDFENIILRVKSERKYNVHSFRDLRRDLLTKNDYFERK